MAIEAEERLIREVRNSCEQHPSMQITLDVAATDELAKKHGWPDAKSMREGIQRVLKTLPPEMAQRIVVKTRGE
ncbi:MAG: hypothetical protein ACAH83_16880 [Alphaproteobacteria bacterium]